MTRKNGLEFITGAVALVLTIAALVLFCLSYTTGYYIFGQMQSGIIATLLAGAIVVEIAALVVRQKFPTALWAKFLTFAVTALLAAAAMLLVGDRVEGIGNCIITDYDSGHGGEEAIYMSLAASGLMLIAMIYNLIGSFGRDKAGEEAPAKGKAMARDVGFGVSALAVLLAVLIPTTSLVRGPGGTNPSGPSGSGVGGTYTVSFNQGNGNAETIPGYQFLCCDLGGMVKADSRMYIDVTLTLDGSGGYTLFADSYVIESGKRAEIGDDTGLGLVLTTNAEGTYTENADGTITTSAPTHAVFEMQTDTYSAQMKGAAGMAVNGSDADGVYDSNDEPAVLDFVPETVWTLSDGAIVTYRDANAGGTYTVSFNQGNGNAESIPDYQFLCCDLGGMVKADSRMYIDVTLTLDGSSYTLFVDSYVIESGKRAEIGDDTGLGLVLTTNATGTYTENADGTITTSVPTHAVFEMQTDTYSAQMKGAAGMAVNGNDADGVYDSNNEPAVLDFVPETIWTLGDGTIETYQSANGDQTDEPIGDGLTVTSDDEATTMTFYADGTAKFESSAYGVEDAATWSYEGGTLTVANANGAEMTASGDPLKLHYVTSVSDQLTGDFTIPAADLEVLLSGGSSSGDGLTVTSDDGATTFTFYADGTAKFEFSAYGVEDAATWSYEGGTLTVANANGAEMTASGDPLKLHYVTSVSDQLTGDFTIPAEDLPK